MSRLFLRILTVVAVLAGFVAAAPLATASDGGPLSPVRQSATPDSSVQTVPEVSVTYDRALDTSGSTSTLTVTDRSGLALQGEKITFRDENKTIVFTPTFTLSEGGSPYTVTERVRSAAGAGYPDLGDADPYRHDGTFTFTVDRTKPASPTISSVHGDTTSPAAGGDTTPTIEVTGVSAGDTVTIFDGATSVGSPKVATGSSVTFNATPEAQEVTLTGDRDHSLTATTTDSAGNVSDGSSPFIYSLDTTQPAAPVISSIDSDTTSPASGNDTSPTVVVTGVTAGDTVRLKLRDTEAGTTATVDEKEVPTGATSVTFNADGTADFTLTGDGTKTFQATAVDPFGNESASSKEFVYDLDTRAPDQPTIDSVNGDRTSPTSGTDQTPTIVVGGVAPGDRVQILVNNVPIGNDKEVPDSSSTVEFNAGDSSEVSLTSGENRIQATSTDPDGNTSRASEVFVYNLDTSNSGPIVTSQDPKPGASVQPRSTVSATFDKELKDTSTITVTNGAGNGVAGTTTFSADKKTITFTSSSTLNEAGSPYTVNVRATAEVNNLTSNPEWTFSVDTTAPAAPVIDSVDGRTTSPATGNDPTPAVIVGGVTAGDTVRLFANGTQVAGKTVPAGADTVTFNPGDTEDFRLVGDSDHELTARTVDRAGNVSPASAAFTYALDTTAPGAPSIASVHGDTSSPASGNDPTPTIVVNGVVEGDTIRILEGEDVLASKVVPAGATSVTFNSGSGDTEVAFASDGTHTITATATDPAGNTSAASAPFTYAVDTKAPVLVSTTPADGSSVAPPASVKATFDEALDPSSTITVTRSGGGAVAGTTSFENDDKTIVLTPDAPLADGRYDVSLTAKDPSTNSRAESFSFTVDTAAPSAPVIDSIEGDTRSPATGNDDTPTVTVSGVTGGDTVALRSGNTELARKVVPAAATTVTFNPGETAEAKLTGEGTHALTATTTDQAGNTSPASEVFNYLLDQTSPVLQSTSPADGSTVTPPSDVTTSYDEQLASSSSMRLTKGGERIDGSSSLADGGRSIRFIPSSTLADGTYAVEATATDVAGNTTASNFTFTVKAAQSTTTTTTTAPGGGGETSPPQGYSLVGEDGSLYAYGTAKNFGDMRGKNLNAPIIGVAYTPGGNGYWLVAKDGGIFTFGDADFYGSMGAKPLNSPVIGMAATPTGKGYWLFAGDGGIFTFGDAQFFGSMGDKKLNSPVINMEPLESGNGYWLVAGDGGIFTFGQAEFFGSMGDRQLNQPVFDMTSTDTDNGYWLVARDGGVFSFGDAGPKFYGSAVEENPRPTRVIGMDSTPGSLGYWIADATGKIYPYGNAEHLGDRYLQNNPAPMIGFASVPGLKL